MARSPSPGQPEGIPKAITPSTGPATDPIDQGDGARPAEPRPAARGTSPHTAERSRTPLPERQPSDAAPPADEGPLESLGKAVSAPVRDAGGTAPSGRGGAPR